jgi:hypothetical protein
MLHYLPKLLWAACELMALTASGILRGLPGAVDTMAKHWLEDYTEAGHSSEYQSWIYIFACSVAVVVLFIGWVLLSYLTVFLVQLLF